jgi:hypothetical protein
MCDEPTRPNKPTPECRRQKAKQSTRHAPYQQVLNRSASLPCRMISKRWLNAWLLEHGRRVCKRQNRILPNPVNTFIPQKLQRVALPRSSSQRVAASVPPCPSSAKNGCYCHSHGEHVSPGCQRTLAVKVGRVLVLALNPQQSTLWPVPFKAKSEEEIPAELQSLYVERDGALVLDVVGAVEKSRPEEIRNSQISSSFPPPFSAHSGSSTCSAFVAPV